MDLSNIFSTLLDNIWNLLPFQKIHEYEQGLRWTWGKAGKILHYGIHPYIPYIQSIDVENTKLQVIHLSPQGLENISCSLLITFRMVDIKERYLTMQDSESEEFIGTIAQGIAADILGGKTAKHILNNKAELETDICKEVHNYISQYGYEADDVKIIECLDILGVRLL